MASINKLSIRGIRAFSPNDDEQVLEFSFPCTMILGRNGCGKTTIIEALKYAITGSFPPGSGRGGSAFVHDPQIIGSSSVKAVVKLRFTSRAGRTIAVIRTMELIQKKATQQFRQLDGVLKMNDPTTGERVSVPHKCTELDKQVPMTLGISKAILEHVLFCHQEDASWPLMEGAVLKKRFDDIFDSTKYSKALKMFRETEKEYVMKSKDLKVDCASLSSHLHAAQGFQQELEQQTEQVDILTEQKREIDSEVEGIDKRLEQLKKTLRHIDDVTDQIESQRAELDRESVAIERQKQMLEMNLMKRGLDSLKKQLREFDETVQAEVDKKMTLENRAQELETLIEDLRAEEGKLKSNEGKLQFENERYEADLKARFKKMDQIARQHKLDLTQLTQSQGNVSFATTLSQSMILDDDDDNSLANTFVSITADDMKGFYDGLVSKREELERKLKEHQDRAQEEEDRLTSSLTDLGGRLQAIENDKNRIGDEKNKAEKEIRQLKDASGSTRMRKSDVDDARKLALQAVKQRDELNNDQRRTQIQAEIRQIEEKMDKIKRKIDDDSIVLERLKSTAEAQSTVATLEEQVAKALEALDELIRDEAVFLEKHGFSVPNISTESDQDPEQIPIALERMLKAGSKRYDEAKTKLDQSTEKVLNSQRLLSEKSALFASSQKSLASLRIKLQDLTSVTEEWSILQETIRSHEETNGNSGFDGGDPTTVLHYIEQKLLMVEEELNDVMDPDAALRLAKKLAKWIKKRMEEGKKCPCCQQKSDRDKLDQFLQDFFNVGKELATSGGASPNVKKMKNFYEDARKKVVSLQGGLRDTIRIREEISEFENATKRLQDEISQCNDSLKSFTSEKDNEQSTVSDIRSLLETLRRWIDDANRISEKRLEIQQKRLDLSATAGTDGLKDFRTVDKEIIELREEKDNLASKINRLNKEVTEINRRISDMSTRASQLENIARGKEEKYAEEFKAMERKKELTIRIQDIIEEEKKLSEQIIPLQQKKKKKEAERQRNRSHMQAESKSLESALSLFEAEVERLKSIDKSINLYEQSNSRDEAAQLSSRMEDIRGRMATAKQNLGKLHPDLVEIRKAVDDRERHKKQLQQNIDIFVAQERIESLEAEVDRLEKERDGIEDSETASEEYSKLEKKKSDLLQKKARSDGMFSSYMDQIRALKRKLVAPEYKDVDTKYRQAMIKHTTTKCAAEDLKKYGNALDKALLKFHGVKIKEINKIIRDLWTLTYKGNDITNIEIQSGQEPGSKAMKSYNYRVVMTKGGTEMDMRGRCSAGQRVLACIVIRLALAETFGTECGCIALDEPTVNLDEDNKAGLAVALASIIGDRGSRQKNFQLILITHDDDFIIRMKTELAGMSGVSMPEKYYEVVREEAADGKLYSKIHAMDWEGLV